MRQYAFLILLLFPILAFTQSKEEIEKAGFFKNNKNLFRAYVVAGANFTQIDGDNAGVYSAIGANAGVGVFVTYTKKFTNSLEITYSMKGAKLNLINPKGTSAPFRHQMDYIDIPLLFNYHDFKVAIFQAGFSYSQLIRSKSEFRNAAIEPDLYKWNFDFVAGVTFLIKEKWGLNFKYNYSILNNLKVNGSPRGTVFGKQAPGKSLTDTGIPGTGKYWYHNVLTFRLMYVIN